MKPSRRAKKTHDPRAPAAVARGQLLPPEGTGTEETSTLILGRRTNIQDDNGSESENPPTRSKSGDSVIRAAMLGSDDEPEMLGLSTHHSAQNVASQLQEMEKRILEGQQQVLDRLQQQDDKLQQLSETMQHLIESMQHLSDSVHQPPDSMQQLALSMHQQPLDEFHVAAEYPAGRNTESSLEIVTTLSQTITKRSTFSSNA